MDFNPYTFTGALFCYVCLILLAISTSKRIIGLAILALNISVWAGLALYTCTNAANTTVYVEYTAVAAAVQFSYTLGFMLAMWASSASYRQVYAMLVISCAAVAAIMVASIFYMI